MERGRMPFTIPSLRRTLALSAAATMVATAVLAMMTATPSAQAKPGRRLCMYVSGERTEDHKTRYVVVNYKKEGKCPPIDSEKYPTLNSSVNPVPKSTCEEVSANVGFESKYYGDLCYILDVDTVYWISKRDGQPFDFLSDIVNQGPVENFS
jgi:hypothetical protein